MDLRDGKRIATGAVDGYEFTTIDVAGFRVHDIKVVGPINLATRIPLYRETLRLTDPPYYFCILDNTDGYENNFSYGDIKRLDRMLIDHGIRLFFGATITRDAGYTKIVKLAQANMDDVGIDGAVVRVRHRAGAEAFITKRIAEAAAVPKAATRPRLR